jgi:hypothetical protein
VSRKLCGQIPRFVAIHRQADRAAEGGHALDWQRRARGTEEVDEEFKGQHDSRATEFGTLYEYTIHRTLLHVNIRRRTNPPTEAQNNFAQEWPFIHLHLEKLLVLQQFDMLEQVYARSSRNGLELGGRLVEFSGLCFPLGDARVRRIDRFQLPSTMT